MTHEKEKAQYEEDRKNYERPWELWEFQYIPLGREWCRCNHTPEWACNLKYRRKDPPFQPEYFSGLNWREALNHLEHKLVEVSHDGQTWHGPFELRMISSRNYDFKADSSWWTYCRTCPDTFQHPTIRITVNGKDFDLPKPETEAPDDGTKYWCFNLDCADRVTGHTWYWDGAAIDLERLRQQRVHLTEARAQAWSDWWKEIHK